MDLNARFDCKGRGGETNEGCGRKRDTSEQNNNWTSDKARIEDYDQNKEVSNTPLARRGLRTFLLFL